MNIMRILARFWAALLLMTAVALAETAPGVEQVELFTIEHRTILLSVTLALTALGFIVLMGSGVGLVMSAGEEMAPAEVANWHGWRRDAGAWPALWRFSISRFWGTVTGRHAEVEASLGRMKQAWRTGDWRREAHWRRQFAAIAGAILTVVGVFGSLAVVGPTPVKVFVGLTLVYVVTRTVRSVARA